MKFFEEAKRTVAAKEAAVVPAPQQPALKVVPSEPDLAEDWDADPDPFDDVKTKLDPLVLPSKAAAATNRRTRVDPQAEADAKEAAKAAAKKPDINTELEQAALKPLNIPNGLKDEDIESFKKLGVEVKLLSRAGTIYLVPEPTGRTDRKEFTIEQARSLALIALAFPGSEVVSVDPVSMKR